MPGYLPTILTGVLLATSAPTGETGWTPVIPALPRPEAVESVSLSDVTATSSNDVWVVGDDGWSGSGQPLTAHWDGAGWAIVPTPEIADFDYKLRAVDAVAPQDVWAVGNGIVVPPGAGWTTARPTRMVTHFDGAAWSIVPAPAPAVGTTYTLEDVDMVSATDGWAVGVFWGTATDMPDRWQPVALRWQGGQWVRVSLPHVPGGNAAFEAVHARAANDVWAVGHQGERSLVMHFDGTSWRRISVAHAGGSGVGNTLRAVTAVSATDVWAGGRACEWVDGSASCGPVVLHLSGGVWRVVPTDGGLGTQIWGVAARSADDVWLVGYDEQTVPGQETNYLEHWDGVRLTRVPVPAAPAVAPMSGLASALESITLVPGSSELWAVGWHGSDAQVIRHG